MRYYATRRHRFWMWLRYAVPARFHSVKRLVKAELKFFFTRAERIYCPRRDESHFGETKRDLPDAFCPTCSYCGSVSPKRLFEIIEAGGEIIPTDKDYKAYVRDGGASKHEHKFYYRHLSAADKTRFIELYNSKKMKIGYPGHFYRAPFFMRFERTT